MDATKKQKLLEKSKEIYTSHNSKKTVDSCVEQFKKKILEGPYHICCVCNRTLYKKSVLKLNTSSYPSQDIFKIQSSYDGKEYICKTCHSKAIQGRLPCQAVAIEFRMTSHTKHLPQLQYASSQCNYCLGSRSNASSLL